MRKTWAAFAALLLSGTLAAAPAFGRGPSSPLVDRPAEDCEETQPEVVALKGVTDDGSNVTLDVLVLLDGVDRAGAKEIIDTASAAYSPIGIDVAARFKAAPLLPAGGSAITQFTEPQALIAAAKALIGNSRPKGIDVVYILTSKDLGTESDASITGYADCIGGVRYPDRSFAVGEAKDEPLEAGITIYGDSAAKVAAHEIGHLLGARHEQQSCAEGLTADDIARREATPCTVMTNYVELQSLNFGTLEGAVVRGHATRYAAP